MIAIGTQLGSFCMGKDKKESESLHIRVVMVRVLVLLAKGIPCPRCLQEWEGVCYLLKDELNDLSLMDGNLDGYL